MPNRILKESICTSDTLDHLSADEERFFYRLIVNCDDFGRFYADPRIVRAKCFPLKTESTSLEDVESWLLRLDEVDLIRLYAVDGKPYLYAITWDNHQQRRAAKSKFPEPDINCNQLLADDCKCARIRIRIRDRKREAYSTREEQSRADANNLAPFQPQDITSLERSVLHELKQVAGYPFDWQKDNEFLRVLCVDYPALDLLDEAKRWRTYKLDKPLEKKSNARSQFRAWLKKAVEFGREIPQGPKPASSLPDRGGYLDEMDRMYGKPETGAKV